MKPFSGTVEIHRLKLFARHGVGEQERKVGNMFEVSVTLTYPIARACADDSIASTLNYAEAIDIIKRQMATPSQLLEHAAARIATALTDTFPAIESGSVTLTKLTPPCGVELDGVSVTLRW